MKALKLLLLSKDAAFSDLQKAMNAESDSANFHIKQLISAGYITKLATGRYTLTRAGKEYANRMDTDEHVIEKQPKVAVCLIINDGHGKQLVQKRLKQPFYGYWGRPTGKIRWGETILETAARELMEETGLTADISFDSVLHKIDYNKASGELLEAKIFFMMRCDNPRGELIERFEGGQNAWMTPDEYAAQPLTFAPTKASYDAEPHMIRIIEDHYEYDPENY